MLGGLGVVALVVRLATVTLPGTVDPRWGYSLPSTFVFFTGGLLLALADVGWRGRSRQGDRPDLREGPVRAAWLGSLEGSGARRSLAAAITHSDTWIAGAALLFLIVCWRYDADALLVAAGFLAVGAVVLPLRRGVLVGVLEWRPLAFLGVCSYSLYLWHFPIVNALSQASWMPHGFLPQLVVAVPLCVAVAVASYLVIEAPFLRLRRGWGASRRRARVEVPATT